MTLKEEIAKGENIALEFKESRPKDSLNYLKMVVAFVGGCGGRMVSYPPRRNRACVASGYIGDR